MCFFGFGLQNIIKNQQHENRDENQGGKRIAIRFDRLFGHIENQNRQGLVMPAGEIADDKVI